jgi:hypothetical protein
MLGSRLAAIGGLSGTATRLSGRLKPKPTSSCRGPIFVAKWRSPLYAMAQGLSFRLRLRLVDQVNPVRRSRQGPCVKKLAVTFAPTRA